MGAAGVEYFTFLLPASCSGCGFRIKLTTLAGNCDLAVGWALPPCPSCSFAAFAASSAAGTAVDAITFAPGAANTVPGASYVIQVKGRLYTNSFVIVTELLNATASGADGAGNASPSPGAGNIDGGANGSLSASSAGIGFGTAAGVIVLAVCGGAFCNAVRP
jgi:hypothetical protein